MSRRAVATAGVFIATIVAAIAQGPDVATFVRALHAEGVPYTEADTYTNEDTTVLLKMLEDEAEVAHWPNIVTTLGVIGSPVAVDGMIKFIEDPESATGDLPWTRYRAKTAAILALGYAANKNEQRSLEYLVESVRKPDVWSERIKWASPFHSTGVERDHDLRSVAVLGLALSGSEEARAVLDVSSNEGALAQPSDVSLLKDALETLNTVAAEGLSAYYANARELR